MKLLIVTTVPITIEVFLLPYAEHFREKGWRVDAIADGVSTSDFIKQKFDVVYDVNWSRSPLRTLQQWRSLTSRVRQIVSKEGYDVVHVHTPVAAFVTRYALRKVRHQWGVRVVYTAHGFHFYSGGRLLRNSVFIALEKLAGRWTDNLVVINQEDLDHARMYNIIPHDRVHHMPGIGIDIGDYVKRANNSSGTAIRQELGLSHKDHVVLMIAELIERKRHADAIDAVSRCEIDNVHLILAGSGPLLEDLKRRTHALGIIDRVHFLGFRRDIPDLLAASDICLLPSAHEGLPRSVMEAMAVGVPVVGTDIRGMRDLLSDGAGVLVPVGAPDMIATAIDRLLSDPEECQQIAQVGRRKIQMYDLDSVIAQHELLYGCDEES